MARAAVARYRGTLAWRCRRRAQGSGLGLRCRRALPRYPGMVKGASARTALVRSALSASTALRVKGASAQTAVVMAALSASTALWFKGAPAQTALVS